MIAQILVATIKPFAREAIEQISKISSDTGYELILLESYDDQKDLFNAVAGVDGLIVRSDPVTRDVFDAAKKSSIYSDLSFLTAAIASGINAGSPISSSFFTAVIRFFIP